MRTRLRAMDTAMARGLRALRHAGRARCPPPQGLSHVTNDCPSPRGLFYADDDCPHPGRLLHADDDRPRPRCRFHADDDCAPGGHDGGRDALPPRARRAPAMGTDWRGVPWRGEGSWRQGTGPWGRGHLALARAARRVLLVLAFGIAVAPASGADGEDGPGDAEEVGAVDEPVAAVADATDKEAERPPRPPVARDVFVPSEEISEDVEVPFPVDI